jgi:hypothetical protein
MTDDERLACELDRYSRYTDDMRVRSVMKQAADRLAALAPLGKLFAVMETADKKWGDVPMRYAWIRHPERPNDLGIRIVFDLDVREGRDICSIECMNDGRIMCNNSDPIPPGTTILIPKEQRDGSTPARLFPMRSDARPGYPIDRKEQRDGN